MEVIHVFCFIFIILGCTNHGNGKAFTPPRIIFPDSNEYIINSGDNLTLRCEGKEPITWSYPNNTDYNDFTIPDPFSTLKIESSTTPDSVYRYGSILTISNASFMNTGYYYCHATDTTDFEDLYSVSNTYIYVRDPEQLSVLSEMPYGVMAKQYSRVVLPCRPTSPDVQVELYQTTGEEIENVSYDPKIGFTVDTNDLLGQIINTCIFNKGNKTFDLDVLLSIQPITYSIAKPYIEELSGGHTVVGEKLELKCTLKVSVQFIMEWITPNNNHSGQIHLSKSIKGSHDMYYQLLTIERATLDDQGEYTCVVKDNTHKNNNTKFVRIFDTQEHFINLTEENGVYDISVKAGEPSIQWRIDVKAHPVPTLIWYDNLDKEISSGWSDNKNTKYETRIEASEAFLKINDITIHDGGYYTLKATSEYEEKPLKLFLNVTDKPTVEIKMADFHLINEESTIECVIAAYPHPSVYWFYKNCQDESCDFEPQKPSSKDQSKGLQMSSYLKIKTNRSGYVMCLANNSLGTDKSIQGFFVSDVSNGFGIWGMDEDIVEKVNGSKQMPVAKGETITIYCAASQYNYTNQPKWYKNNGLDLIPLENDDRYSIEKSSTEFSNKTTLTIHNVNYTDSGNYTCRVMEDFNSQVPNAVEKFQYDNITIKVTDPQKPIIVESNLNNSEATLKYQERLELWCFAKGIPKPTVTWYKDGIEQIETTTASKVLFSDNNQRMIIPVLEDESSFECKAKNKEGEDRKQLYVNLENKPQQILTYVLPLLAVSCFCIGMGGFFYCRYRKERNLRRELKRAGLANFENGALDSLNPELGVDDQAELLPYDKKWELPREKLKLGKQLGSGAFGVVMKAVASGIVDGEETTTVAVKMVKRNADYTYIRALASELKIMVHLGKHLNVVNLLGACTKNVVKRELLVIVEYCRFGNLHNYLLRHRDGFIDQIDAKTGKIDYTFGAEILERSFSVSSNSDNTPLPSDMADYRGNFNYSGETANTATTTVTMTPTGGDDTLIVSNNSAQPEWRSNYRGDYKGNVKPICTKDLITWAFQVARGMEYLASRKVLHGDLAARNILLAENNIVKICDFGLAKSMYKSDNYKKKGDGPLPVKWMAVESIRDRVFSTQSDVWSYGIVLWEFFSLARTPYPGMEADERLYNKLMDGYRMDSPEFATKEIYTMMCDCWHPKPLLRPSFTKLAESIGLMLEESVRQHYVDLNDPYLVMNTQRLEGHNDYLAMLSPPDFEHLSSPHHYVNDEIKPDMSPHPDDTPGYLCMKSSHVFSPRLNEETIFNFDMEANNKKHKNSNGEIALGTELLPMLHTQSESDCETPHVTTSPTSFSNPTYHIPPDIIEKTDEDIVKTADNYVNMPQNKSAIKSDKVLNSNIDPSTNTNSNNYVNSSSRDWERMQV